MKKFLILFSAIIVLSISANAQRKQDVVYLKNGSMIRGVMLEFKPDEYVKIETKDRSVWVFNNDQIEKVTKEARLGKQIQPKYHGYYMTLSTGFLPGRGNWGTEVNVFLRMVNGYQFNEKFGLGFGTELSGLDSRNGGLMPLFLEPRYYLLKNRTAPYLLGQAGWSMPLWNQSWQGRKLNNGGPSLGASLGIRHHFSSGSAFDVSFGYLFQQSSQNFDRWSQWGWNGFQGGFEDTKTINYFNRVAIRFGFFFN